ncbi:MAG: hypothetical protein IKN89_12005 [Oscillospiraceae bacterium]|nr:hypothetical protein [Oscillospiraceae bacterium]
MKMLSVLLIALLLLGLCCFPAMAAAPARLRAAFTLEHIPADGTDGGPWASAEAGEIKNAKKGDAAAPAETDTRGTLRALWDGERLYLLVSVRDATPAYSGLFSPGRERSGGGYNFFTQKNDPDTYRSEDGVEFSLDFWNDKSGKFEDDDGLFTVTREGLLTYELNAMVANHSSLHAMESNREYSDRIAAWAVREQEDGSGYNVFLCLELFGAVQANGTLIGLDVMIGDSPADGLPRTSRVYWSHEDDALPAGSQDFNTDWGEIELSGWNGQDPFPYDDWKLRTRLRWLRSPGFVKGVWTPESQEGLDAAVREAEAALESGDRDTVNRASADLEAAIAALRWGDDRYPDPMDLPVVTTLPSIYEFFDGRAVTGPEDWAERRAEILDLAQFYEYGYKPPMPDSIAIGALRWTNGGFDWATFANQPAGWVIPVSVTYGGKTETIEYTLALPDKPDRPAPVLLSFGADSATLLSKGIAVLEVPVSVTSDDRNDPWLNRMTGGNRAGTLRSFFPYHRDGDLNEVSNEMLAALGCSIGIDALEKLVSEGTAIGGLGQAGSLIDPGKLAVSGFSINGKYAFVSAVFDERIDVCIPAAAGATGPAVWRYNMNYPQGGNLYSWGLVSGGELLADSVRHNPGRTTELFRRFLTPGRFYAREGSDYGYGCRLPFDQEELVASLVLAPRQGSEKPRAIVLEHTVDDYADQSQGDALSLEIAKSVWDWLGFRGEDYVKFCFRQKGGHGTEPWQTAYIAEYLHWYFFDTPMSGAAAENLATDPFAADVLDGLDGWERNYGGLKAVAPWLEEGPNPVPVADSRAEESSAAPAEAPVPTHAPAVTPEPTTSPLPAPRPKGPGALIAAILGILVIGGTALGVALKKRKKR